MVRGYVTNGFHLEELTDDTQAIPVNRFPSHPGGGTGILPTGFHHRPSWTVYGWQQSKRRSSWIDGVQQYTQGGDAEPGGFVDIPASRLLRITYDQDGADYTGLAVLRSAYQPWKLKIAFLTIDAIKHERTGVGIPSITLSEKADEEDISKAEEILAEMRANEKGYIVLPEGYKFEWTGAGESSTSNLDAAISRCNIDIAHNVATGFMLLSLTGGTGSRALAGTQQGSYHLTIDSHGALVSEALNLGSDGFSPVERLVRQNYGQDAGIPRLAPRNLPTRDWHRVIETVSKSVAAGVLTADAPLEAQMRESIDLGPHDPSTARARPVSLGTPPKEQAGEGDST